jgi:F-type H+-transporting ATPase subunit c
MFLSILNAGVAAAAEEAPSAVAAVEASGGALFDNGAFLAIAAGLCIAVGVLGASKAMGKIASSALDGTARQPEMSNKLFTTMLISMALVEALAIYCLLIAFMLLGKM